MAINPATGLEDPNYVPDGETPLVQPAALSGLETPPLELSNQDQTMEDARTNIETTGTWANEQLANVDQSAAPDYAGYDANQLKEESALGKGSDYITPEATVANQMEQLLNSESQYMKTAERRAREQAAQLGLLGSSMAVGASQRAAIESAMPIAQQDAQTYAQAALAEQATSNEISRMKAESDLSAEARKHVYDIDAQKAKFNAQVQMIADSATAQAQGEVQMALQKMASQWEAETKAYMTQVDAELSMKLNAQEISAREREYASTTSSQVMAASYGTINDLMGNADFMAGYADNPDGLTKVFNNFINLGKDQVRFIGATAGLTQEYSDPDTGYLNFIGTWV